MKRKRSFSLTAGAVMVALIVAMCLVSFVWMPMDPEKMDTARGLDLSICPVPSAAQTVWKNKSGVVGVWKITCDSVSGGLTLTFDCAGQTGKLALAKYNEAKKCFEQVSEKKWSVSGSILTASNMSAGIYGVIKIG